MEWSVTRMGVQNNIPLKEAMRTFTLENVTLICHMDGVDLTHSGIEIQWISTYYHLQSNLTIVIYERKKYKPSM